MSLPGGSIWHPEKLSINFGPWLSLAVSRSFPTPAASLLTVLLQGLPLFRVPWWFHSRAFFSMAVTAFLKVCPSHLHLLFRISRSISTVRFHPSASHLIFCWTRTLLWYVLASNLHARVLGTYSRTKWSCDVLRRSILQVSLAYWRTDFISYWISWFFVR